jgi:hypothetical protein
MIISSFIIVVFAVDGEQPLATKVVIIVVLTIVTIAYFIVIYPRIRRGRQEQASHISAVELKYKFRNAFRRHSRIIMVVLVLSALTAIAWTPTSNALKDASQPKVVIGEEQTFASYKANNHEPIETAVDLEIESNRIDAHYYQGTFRSYNITSAPLAIISPEPVHIKNPSPSSSYFSQGPLPVDARSFIQTPENEIHLKLTNGQLVGVTRDNESNIADFIIDSKPTDDRQPINAKFSFFNPVLNPKTKVTAEENYVNEAGRTVADYKIVVSNLFSDGAVQIRKVTIREFQLSTTNQESVEILVTGLPHTAFSHNNLYIYPYITVEPGQVEIINIRFDVA